MGELKKCAKCETEKPLDAFNTNTSSKDGKQRYCRDCNKSYGRNYYKKHTKGERKKKNNETTGVPTEVSEESKLPTSDTNPGA